MLYKDKLRVCWFKHKGGVSFSSVKRTGFPPTGGAMRSPTRPSPFLLGRPSVRQQVPTTQNRREISVKDKEMEETLKKLKEMSK